MKMMRIVLLAVLAASSTGASHSQTAPAIPNAGFEQNDGRMASGWSGQALVSTDAHSGRAAGLVRSADRKPSMFQVMLKGVRAGRLGFWYKALKGVSATDPQVDSNIHLDVGPLNAQGHEPFSHHRKIYKIPAAHMGDGRWHHTEIAFNYMDAPDATGIFVGPRINELTIDTMPTGPGEVLFDDFTLTPLGPQPRLGTPAMVETPGREGEEGHIICDLTNEGDMPLAAATSVTLSLPKGADLTTTDPVRKAPSLAPKATARLVWGVLGRRADRAYSIRIDSSAFGEGSQAPEMASTGTVFAPDIQLRDLTVPSLVLWQGERQKIVATLTNAGSAAISNVKVDLRLPAGVQCVEGSKSQTVATLAPGAVRPLAWTIAGSESGALQMLEVVVTPRRPADNLHPISQTFTRELMVSRKAAGPADVPARAEANLRGDCYVLGNPTLRLVFPKNPLGYGVADVQALQNGGWRSLGVVPWPARVRYRNASGQQVEHVFTAESMAFGSATPDAAKDPAMLSSTAPWRDPDGAEWRLQSTLSLTTEARWVEVATTLTVDQPRDLLLCEGAVLLAGEGSTGAAKELAVFPGLDIIGPQEQSSAIWNPTQADKDRRTAPDPIKITIPIMAVSGGGATVGLMWNALDKWDGAHDRLSARFLSPDFEEHYAHHWLSLFAPTVPEWVDENTRQAARPYRLEAGKPLTFRYQIVAHAPASALDVQRDWFDRYGLPAIPTKPWTYEQFIRQAIDVDNAKRFEADRGGWFHMGSSFEPGTSQFNPQLATDMWIDSIRTTDTARRAFLRERVMTTARQHAEGAELTLPFHIGLLIPALEGDRRSVARMMSEQLPGGGWPLTKNPQLPEWIGKDGTVVSGTCAKPARRLMEYARITGAPDAYAAARRGLEALERDPIPRGGQTWEVPVQVADVIVSGDAALAYLDAWRISGDPADLARARYWAATAVNFIYVWQVPGKPVMNGCSIAVYGNAWFGRPVQWCGRDVIEPFLDLADAGDTSYPWRRLAECLSVALMQQTVGPDLKIYPDNSATPPSKPYCTYPYPGWQDFDRSGMMLIDNFLLRQRDPFPCWQLVLSVTRENPGYHGFVDNLLRLLGDDPRPQTVVVRGEGSATGIAERIHVTTPGRLSDVRALLGQGGKRGVAFTVSYYPGQTAHAVVAGLGQPARVLRDGRPLPSVPDLDAVSEGWHRHRGMLLVKIPDAGKAVIIVEGATLETPTGAVANATPARRPAARPAPAHRP